MFGSNKKEESNRFSSFLFVSYVSTLETKILPVISAFQKFLIISIWASMIFVIVVSKTMVCRALSFLPLLFFQMLLFL